MSSIGRLRDRVAALLAAADVQVDGERPWDPRVHDPRFYRRALAEGALGIGESYHLAVSRVVNLQTRTRSRRVAREHYDLDTDLYMSFLDPYNQYTCLLSLAGSFRADRQYLWHIVLSKNGVGDEYAAVRWPADP